MEDKAANQATPAATFNIVARAAGYGEVRFTSDITAPTRDGWTAVYHVDGHIYRIACMAGEDDLKKVEKAYAKTHGASVRATFAAFAASLSGEECDKTGFNVISNESRHLRDRMYEKGTRPFDDFVDSICNIFDHPKASASLFAKLKVVKPSAP
jgi:hypothetical protein